MSKKQPMEEQGGLDLRAFVLAGGEGTRLQALTRRIEGDWRPKQFSKIFGGKSLLTHTRERLRSIFTDDQVGFVVIRNHESFYTNELADVAASRILVQPSNRGTGVAIIAALLQLLKSDDGSIVGFFPSDHYFANNDAFATTVESAIEVSRRHSDSIVLIGARPQWPEVEYGWIEPGASITANGQTPLFNVNRFWEKPPLATARELMNTGGLWNTFVTVGHVNAFLKLLTSTVPAAVPEIAKAFKESNADAAYRTIPAMDFSKHVLSQNQHHLLVIEDKLSGWADLGNPTRVIDTLIRNRIMPSWLRKMLDVPRLLEEITGVRSSAHTAAMAMDVKLNL